MRGAVIERVGAEPTVRDDLMEPVADPGSVLVKVEAAAVNAIDLVIAAGGLPRPPSPLPYVPGREGVGTVVSPGPMAGTRVWFEARGGLGGDGAMAEYAIADSDILVPVPTSVSSPVAARYGIAGTAAWLAVEWRGHLRPGEHVLVLGADSPVGRIAVQTARALGAARVVGAARRPADTTDADSWVALDGRDDLSDRISAATRGRLDLIIDPLWGSAAMAALDAASDGARLVQMGSSAAGTTDVEAFRLRPQRYDDSGIVGRNLSILGHTNMAAPTRVRAESYRRLIERVAAGEIDVPATGFPIDDISAAFAMQRSSAHRKAVVLMDDDSARAATPEDEQTGS